MSSMSYPSRGIIFRRLKFYCNRQAHTVSKTLQVGPVGFRFTSASSIRFASTHVFDHATVTCLPGLESVLSDELKILGVQHRVPKTQSFKESSRSTTKTGKIKLQDVHTTDDLFRCCLYLGTATQVRLNCASFNARGLPELKRKTARIPWAKILKPDCIENGNLTVRVVSSKSKLYHTGAIRERVIQAIGQNFGKDESYFQESNEKENQNTDTSVHLDVKLSMDQVEISINAYPTPLHQRGYRQQVAKAPLREDIAYAMLFSAGWIPSWGTQDDDQNTTTGNIWQGLVDPFCGSGTIPIEGAAMMLGLPPGRFRENSPFQGTVLEDERKWSSIVRKSLATSETGKKLFPISASDRDAGAVESTKANAKRAGVLDALTIERAPLLGQRWFEKPSESPPLFLVVTNPPYGKRVSSKSSTAALLKLHQSLGHSIQRLARDHERKLSGVVLTNNSGLLTRSGVSFNFKTSFKTFHGGLKVSAMKFDFSNV